MKTRLLIIIGLIIVIIISVSALIIIDNIESQTSNSHLQSILDSCYAQKNNLIHTQEHRSISNDTHFIDNKVCEWIIIENSSFNPPSVLGILHALDVADKEKLQKVLDDCASSEEPEFGLVYRNDTHYIGNRDCTWEPRNSLSDRTRSDYDPNIPYELQLVLDDCGARFYEPDIKLVFTNDTHQINNVDCEWETPPKGNLTSFPVEELQTALESCSGKFGIPLERKTLWINDTHMIDSKTCELEKRKNSGVSIDRTVYPVPVDESLLTVFSIREKIEINGNRLEIFPSLKIMNFTNPVTVTFVNDSDNPVNIFDNARGKWSFKNVEPTDHRNLIINSTGYHKILVQDSRHGTQTTILVLSENTNSLPVEIRAKMAQIYLRTDSHRGDEIIGVGSGAAEPGLTIGINEKFQDMMDDAEKFYYEKYRNIIPFDVPITIEFRGVPTLN